MIFLENHDQLANEGLGERLWTRVAPGRLRALTALTLLAPSTPLLFQGQEWNATARFAYFADQGPDLAGVVKAGPAEVLRPVPPYASPQPRHRVPRPGPPPTLPPSPP